MKNNHKHLTLSDRIAIEQGLNAGQTFAAIASSLSKDSTTISKEVRKHRTIKPHTWKARRPNCIHLKECRMQHLCKDIVCYKYCKDCSKCYNLCPHYEIHECKWINKAPYVCNSCKSLNCCPKNRWIYVAKYADDSYHELLSSSREGINQDPEKMQELDRIVSPLLKKGQSLSHIYASHAKELGCSRRTLYKYIDLRVFTARNGDLPRKVKYKPRKTRTIPKATKRATKLGRTYEDFTKKLQKSPEIQVVEMDTVEGQKGGKVLLTLLFRSCSLMLAFLIEEKSQKCVNEVFDYLTYMLRIERFQTLFPIILTDNGTEFQDTDGLECDCNGEIRTKIYYCHPNCSWQKGMIEKNHEYIRYVVPKGTSFDGYTQNDISLMMSHINNTARDSLNGCTPYQLSRLLFGSSLLEKLSIIEIAPDDVMLKSALLKH